MAESKEKNPSKKTTVTVAPQLLRELKNEQNRLLNSGQPEPSQGELLNRAWRSYINAQTSAPNLGNAVKNFTNEAQTSLKTSGTLYDSALRLSDAELVWVERFLRLLRAKTKAIRRAIKYNVLSFGLIGQGVKIREQPDPAVPMSDADLDIAIAELERTADEIEADQNEAGESDEGPGTRRSGT